MVSSSFADQKSFQVLLSSIQKPSDIKKLSMKDLEKLCQELRDEIVQITEKNGGHLGSNLGSVELIVAIHYVFDSPNDKFVFDVGHQSYAHKLLTGRQKLMQHLRQENGASGFASRSESEHDPFISGHASTSLSAAIGIAKGRDLNLKNFNIVSIVGDGALSGGMIYEALNNVANLKNFLIILNDNQMSISQSVGSMKKYLVKLLASRKGLLLRKKISKIFDNKFNFLQKFIKNSIFSISGWNIFEEFGLQYLGPIDGHNLKNLICILQNLKKIANHKPVLIHAITKKGKGYAPAEKDQINMHGVGQNLKNTYTEIFEKHIVRLAEADPKIITITAAMKSGTGLSLFASKFPERFFDVGIAEEHAVTFAAGLATQGLKPYVAIYSTFLQRSFDQIYHDVVLQNLPVKFIIDKAGFPGPDGKTHSGIYDIAMLQNFPNMVILSPSSEKELINMLDFSKDYSQGPLAIRFPKANGGTIFDDTNLSTPKDNNSCNPFSNKFQIVRQGQNTLILSVGALLKNVYEAIEISKTHPTVIDVRFLKPFCFVDFYEISLGYKKIVVLEEGVFGGFSGIFIEELLANKRNDILNKMIFLTASKIPTTHFSSFLQQDSSNLSAQKIADLLRER